MSSNSSISLPYYYFGIDKNRRWNTRSAIHRATSPKLIYIQEINETLSLKKPLALKYQYEGGYYYVVFERGPMLITAVDEKVGNLSQKFRDELQDAWEYYALESDSNLTEGAAKVKKWLLDNIISYEKIYS